MKTLTILLIAIISFGFFSGELSAQAVQTIRGKVFDADSKVSLPGANILLLNSTPPVGAATDVDGNFELRNVPLGRQGVQVSYMGYKAVTISNLIVNSAQEVVLEIGLQENVFQSKEVEIKAEVAKDQSINKMATVSARSFTVEETEKFAGSRGDVARMAMNYAGVSAANDQRNDIIIRGNSPSGLLWRLEDVDIPNPNHFAENGTTGGPVGMLNNNLLQNSDFFTGAFPAEYGNAQSGVFDLKMRNGNNNRHEFLFQTGFNGFEVGAEGPFTKAHKSSYLFNYRYSTLQLMSNIIDIGTAGIPKYQDLSFKFNIPVNKGRITLFGVGGISEIAMLDSKQNKKDLYSDEGQDLYNRSNTAASGISYTRFLNDKKYFKVSLSGLVQDGGTKIDTLDIQNQPHNSIDHNFTEYKGSLSAYLNTKYNSRLNTRVGVTVDRMGFNLLTKKYYVSDSGFRTLIDYKKSLADGDNLYRAYYQATFRISEAVSINPGVHFIYLDFNKTYALEPRFGISWQVSEGQKFSAGYGLHSSVQSLSTYFLGTTLEDYSVAETNKDLGFTKSHQLVLAYDVNLGHSTRLKAEAYYQYLFNVPVEIRSSSFNILNTGAGWGVGAQDSLVNDGTGKNYGLEFTLEKFFSNNYYYLATLSVFQSKYKGSDGIERNTAFNSRYVLNCLVGKEFAIKKKSAFTVDFKLSMAGGRYYTPIDMVASAGAGETKYDESKAYSLKYDPFLKADIKVGYRLNGKKVSQEWQFYVENFTNHKNILLQSYSKSSNEIQNTYQLGAFPMVLYRIHF
ncbi:MAG: TonB-dependent receptor [Bacteroidales bacterium]|nr:TonB-dependent receptor [Bacteroidales bacterium]